jgi:hypothetical protein
MQQDATTIRFATTLTDTSAGRKTGYANMT